MGLFGGSSSSSTSNYTQTEANSSTVGIEGANNGLLLSNLNRSTVNVTDGGSTLAALNANRDVTKSVLDSNFDVSKLAIDSNTDIIKEVSRALDGVANDALRTTERATNSAFQWVGQVARTNDTTTMQEMNRNFTIAAVAVAVALIFRGKI